MIKYGFKIEDDKIYDTQIVTYELKKRVIEGSIIYYMIPKYYKRLYLFEPLLEKYSIDKVFSLLNYNSFLSKQRKLNPVLRESKLSQASNMSTIYNYPPSYLTQKKFTIYKVCQALKKRIR